MGINSALHASSLAIKRVIEGRIAHLGHQFSTSCLIPGNQMGHTLDLKYGNQKGHRVEKQTSALFSDQTVTDQ